MADFTPEIKEPITVKASATPVVMSETFKIAFTAFFAFMADRYMHDQSAIIAVLAASGIVATWVWGLWHRLRSWSALRYLASLVDDGIAVIGGRHG